MGVAGGLQLRYGGLQQVGEAAQLLGDPGPEGVSEYSTRGGIAVSTSRVSIPSRSRVCRVWESIRSLTPSMRRRSALNRYRPSPSANRASEAHFEVTSSKAAREVQPRANTSLTSSWVGPAGSWEGMSFTSPAYPADSDEEVL
ncbi:hypothetical protein GCM10027614_18230 [Micromonospora vulcania]